MAKKEKLRWSAKVTYAKTKKTNKVVKHEFQELHELQDLIEDGPNFAAVKSIVITYNFTKITLKDVA